MLFFELLQIAIGNRKMLSHTPTAEEWRELYTLAKKQTMVGIAFCGVEKLPKEQRPPKQLLMQWYMVTERIKAMNTDLDRKALAVANKFFEEGFPGVVLKGQGIAQLYKVERSTVNSQQSTDGPHPSKLSTKDSLVPINRQSEQPTLSHRVGSRERGDSGHPGCSQISHTEITEYTEFSGNADTISHDMDLNSQNARIASLACGHPDGTVDRRPLTVDTCLDSKQVERSSISNYRTPGDIDIWLHGERDEILEYVRRHIPDCKPVYHHVDFPVLDDVSIEVHFTPTWMNSPMRNRCLQRFFKSMVNSQQSTDGLFNQRDKHTNLDALTHTQACAGHPGEDNLRLYENDNENDDGPHPSPLQERGDSGHLGCSQISHTEFTENTEISCNAENICQRELDTNSQNARIASLACGHPDEGFDLTQKAQKAQNLHDASPVPSGVIACSDHELHGLHEYSGASETKIISHGCSRIDTDSRIASLACGHPDGTVDRRQLTVDTCLDSKQATLPTPNNAFNRIYILVHIYRHLFAEGIGLKQLLDYYFVLQQGFTEVEREETLRTLRSLGMMRFTRAVMWVLQEVYGLPDRYLLTSPDEEEGRFLLSEIMLAGNFGQHDERLQRAEGEGTFRWGLRKVMRNFRFVRSYPSEVLWSPLFKVWHLFWRIREAT